MLGIILLWSLAMIEHPALGNVVSLGYSPQSRPPGWWAGRAPGRVVTSTIRADDLLADIPTASFFRETYGNGSTRSTATYIAPETSAEYIRRTGRKGHIPAYKPPQAAYHADSMLPFKPLINKYAEYQNPLYLKGATLGSSVRLGAEGDLSYLAIRLLRKDGSPMPGILVEAWAVGPVYREESNVDGVVIFSFDGIQAGTQANVTIFDPSCGQDGCTVYTSTDATATEAFETIREYVSKWDYKPIQVVIQDPKSSDTSGGETGGGISSGMLIGGAVALVLAAVFLG